MKKKQATLAMIVLVIPATTSCTDIVGIDEDYHLRGLCEDKPLVVADMQQGANYVAVDATNVYWTNRSSGEVISMAIDSGSHVWAVSGQNEPRCIAVDATHVYWTNVGDGTVKRVALDGSNLTTLATGQNHPYDIVVTDKYVFWTNEGTQPNQSEPPLNDGEIKRLERYKTDPIPNPPPDPITLVPNLNYPQAIAVYETSVYWTDADNLMKTDIEGVKRLQIDTLPESSNLHTQYSDIAVNNKGIFWTDTDNNKVKKAGITGSEPVQLAANDQTPFGIAVDATHVYWTSTVADPLNYVGAVYKVGIDGGSATTLATDQPYPVGIAVDETCIYWANYNNGTIMKLAK